MWSIKIIETKKNGSFDQFDILESFLLEIKYHEKLALYYVFWTLPTKASAVKLLIDNNESFFRSCNHKLKFELIK